MNTKENRPDAATSERIGAGKAAWGAFFPYHDFNTVPRRRQVSSFLRVGKEHAIKLGDLAALTGMGERALRRQIQRERQRGALIISDCRSGYFLPETAEDIRVFVGQMKHRAREINSVCRAAEIALAEAEGQTMMEGF